jgi:hypothetical protein
VVARERAYRKGDENKILPEGRGSRMNFLPFHIKCSREVNKDRG